MTCKPFPASILLARLILCKPHTCTQTTLSSPLAREFTSRSAVSSIPTTLYRTTYCALESMHHCSGTFRVNELRVMYASPNSFSADVSRRLSRYRISDVCVRLGKKYQKKRCKYPLHQARQTLPLPVRVLSRCAASCVGEEEWLAEGRRRLAVGSVHVLGMSWAVCLGLQCHGEVET
ncbi:hypothetical protein F5146DRAFT_233884 [Armillaria mellea]|nr:hypothetical protein F5146DRAFT_233884 [Armillaria mellea]